MVTQEDTIFVSGMDPSISEDEICQHFGAIGVIKVFRYFAVRKINLTFEELMKITRSCETEMAALDVRMFTY